MAPPPFQQQGPIAMSRATHAQHTPTQYRQQHSYTPPQQQDNYGSYDSNEDTDSSEEEEGDDDQGSRPMFRGGVHHSLLHERPTSKHADPPFMNEPYRPPPGAGTNPVLSTSQQRKNAPVVATRSMVEPTSSSARPMPVPPSRSATHHDFNASVGVGPGSSPSCGSRMTAHYPDSYGSGSDRGSLADRGAKHRPPVHDDWRATKAQRWILPPNASLPSTPSALPGQTDIEALRTSYPPSIAPPSTSRTASTLHRGASSTGLRNATHGRTHASSLSSVPEPGRVPFTLTPVVTRVEKIWLPPASEYERERQEEAARLRERERDRERERERKREATTPFRIPQHKPTTMSITSTGTPTRTSRPGSGASVYLPGSSAQYNPVVAANPGLASGRPPSMYPSSVASSNGDSMFSAAAPGSSYTSSGTAFLHHTISESPPSSPQLFPHGPNALHPPPRKQTFAAIQDGPLCEAVTSAEAIHREAGGPQNVDIWEENLRSEQEISMQQIARERHASVGNDPPSSAGPSSSRQATSSSTTGTSRQRRDDQASPEFLERNAERRASGLQRQREEVEARERHAQEREDVRRRKERQKRESEEAAVNMRERERQREVEIMPNRAAGTLADLRKHYDDLNITNSISSVSTYVSGCGGHADIYKGLWIPSRTNKKSTEPITVAVKRLRVYVESGTESANIRKLRQEISIWRRLRHDNVQMLHGLWWDDPNVFPGMVSTWEDHGDINAYLKKLQSSTGTNELVNIKLSLLADVLQGLIYLHSQKVIHADLKGANILVSRDGKALLTDFGIAWTLVKTSQSFTADRDSKGSTRWMAPQLLAGSDGPQALYTTGSDAWAYGCLFLEVCSGLLPYFKKHLEPQVIHAVCCNLGPCRPDNMDDKLWAIVEYCCTYSVERRPSAVEILARLQPLRFPPDANDFGSRANVDQHSVVTMSRSPPPTLLGPSIPGSPTDSDSGSVISMLRSPPTSIGLPDRFEEDMSLYPDIPWQSLPSWAQQTREDCLVSLHSKNIEVEQRYRAGLEDMRGRGRGKKDTRELEATRRSSLSRNTDEEVRRLLKMLQFNFMLQQPPNELAQWEKDFEENPPDHILHLIRGIYLGHVV